jgi:DNA-binding GntR family transcriptional regulator
MGTIQEQHSGNVQVSVYAALRQSIINLNLEPGTVISEKEIALRYKISRTPVREAFIHLSQEALVQVIPQKGTLVSLIDVNRAEQEFFLRLNLELAVQKSFMKNCRPEHFERLESLIKVQSKALKQREYIEFLNYDDAFHRVFFEAAGQELSWVVLETLCGHYHRIRLLTAWFRDIAEDLVREHRQLLKALSEKNPAAAKKQLKEHLSKLQSEETMLREKFPNYFSSPAEQNAFDIDFGGLSFQKQ